MALDAIQDFLPDFPGWSTEFDLMWRDEISRTQGGSTRVKELGGPLWRAAYESRSLSNAGLRAWKARLHSLENGIGLFYAYDLSGCYPIQYPNGSWPDPPNPPFFNGETAAIHTLPANNKLIRIDGLPAGFILSVGDYFHFDYGAGPSRALHQVVDRATADANGVTEAFEVRPAIRTGAAVNDTVFVKRPRAVMMLVPGSVSAVADRATGRGIVAFQAIQVI